MIIPGIFPPTPLQKSTGVLCDPRGGLRHCFFTDDATRSHRFRWSLRDLAGKEVLCDEHGYKVFRMVRGTVADYYVITDPKRDVIPFNTSVLHILIDDRTELVEQIVVESSVFKERGPLDYCDPGINQVGSFYLTAGDVNFQHDYPYRFRTDPLVVLTQVMADPAANPMLVLNATVAGYNEHRFSGILNAAPNTPLYRLGWVAWC